MTADGSRAAEARRCTNCGAAPRSTARFCEYCGVALAALEPAPSANASPFGDLAARFAALEAHPDLPGLLQAAPAGPSFLSSSIGLLFGMGVTLVVGVFMLTASAMAFPPFTVLVVAMLAFVLIAGTRQIVRQAHTSRAPLERRLAAVVNVRTKIVGDGERGSVRSLYYATLQLPEGSRRELEVSEESAGHVAPGDLGVAYLRAETLVAFERVGV